jgi:ABC-type sugar transport system ATPase subunit
MSPKERRIAMVFQNYALYPHMTVYDNLAFGLRLSGANKKEVAARVQEAAVLLEMEHLLERYPKQLSGGQAQRVAVGRAIVKKPDVFLFDEPLSNLDAKLRAAMRVRLTELHQSLRASGQSATVIYVTHDQVEAMTMGERICVLKEGVIQQVDTPTRLYDHPANTFVASFIGSPEMNILQAQVLREGDAIALGLDGQNLLLPEAKAQALAGKVQGRVQLGLRPEHILARAPADAPSVAVQGTLRFMEHLGSEVFVHFNIGSLPVTARLGADQLGDLQGKERGHSHTFYLHMGRCLFFDADSGLNLQA